MVKPVLTGNWDDNIRWEFYVGAEIPDRSLCATVYCLAVQPHLNRIVLARNHRGLEMLGGHVEDGESIEQAVVRECLEEGGFVPDSYELFGYQKLQAKRPVPHPLTGGHYPFPVGYLPYFIATSVRPLQKPTGEEIIEACRFDFGQIETLVSDHRLLIELGLRAYKQKHFDLG